VFAEDAVVQPYHLPSNLWMHDEKEEAPLVIVGKSIPLEDLVCECEKQAILRALNETGNNKSRAIELLKLSRRAFYYKLNKYKIERNSNIERKSNKE
jgi:DNA-binding NtrC family response regulator